MKVMNHGEYQKNVKRMDIDALQHVLADCQAAIKAMPDNPNCGYYEDEIHYCAAELHRRTELAYAKISKKK
jgi:hypothetical protein